MQTSPPLLRCHDRYRHHRLRLVTKRGTKSGPKQIMFFYTSIILWRQNRRKPTTTSTSMSCRAAPVMHHRLRLATKIRISKQHSNIEKRTSYSFKSAPPPRRGCSDHRRHHHRVYLNPSTNDDGSCRWWTGNIGLATKNLMKLSVNNLWSVSLKMERMTAHDPPWTQTWEGIFPDEDCSLQV